MIATNTTAKPTDNADVYRNESGIIKNFKITSLQKSISHYIPAILLGSKVKSRVVECTHALETNKRRKHKERGNK